MTVFGTRPEAIKMAPVALALAADSAIEASICVTAQHRQMLDQVMRIFDLRADIDLDLMQPGQDLYDITSRVLLGMRTVLQKAQPDLVLVHGDTTTCFAAALAAFYQNIPVGHVEAGLRTGDLRAPFPEEANRSLVGRIARLHFAPTIKSAENLLSENVAKNTIYVTGNTVIDALLIAREKVKRLPLSDIEELLGTELVRQVLQRSGRLVLITGHRRENFGQGFIDLCSAIRELASAHTDWLFVYPVHLNPNVQQPVREVLGDLSNVKLIEPADYLPFIWLMDQSDLILTDSGGIQEEGPSLGKPVLVMRDVTERPEAVAAGTVKLVGTDRRRIVDAVELLLRDQAAYRTMATATNPFGDGTAAQQIVATIKQTFLTSSERLPA
ncbi:MAG TPA: UDP-N-acetylglucosamine 2-epimerase (non-hydrolyzing) [Spongiibacteraceae bacterium]|nr:UDP-N-acetylglucosamine 2-epimerase (non-hydrolyzing) [Spongiibacteraceae bacterium]